MFAWSAYCRLTAARSRSSYLAQDLMTPRSTLDTGIAADISRSV